MNLRAYVTRSGPRLVRAAITLPRAHDLVELGLAGAGLALVVGPLGFWTGLLVWRQRAPAEIMALAASALLAPGLGEEAPFRGLLIPDRTETDRACLAIAGSTGLFCLWHVVEALTFLPKARSLFLRPDFLAWTVLLGLACAMLRRRSGSIWPPVLLHWIAVVAWQGWLGGPDAAALR